MKSLSKNKYAKSKRTRLKPFMHKVDVWLPTMTYNKLKDQSMANSQDISQLASVGLYRAINQGPDLMQSWNIPLTYGVTKNLNYVIDVLSKFILATLKSGIHQDDVMMNGLDSGLSQDEIVLALNQMYESKLIEVETNGMIRYKYYSPIEKKDSLVSFKGKKVISKIKVEPIKREVLVKKLKPKENK